MPSAAILTIGSELLLGKVIDTNGAYLGEVLSSIGFDVDVRVSVGDRKGATRQWLRRLADQVDLIVTTGGLGPTEDDLTRREIADAAGVSLVFHEELMDEIAAIFAARGYRMTENNRKQAYLPKGATPISNPVGTAPAFITEMGYGKEVIALPGVPRELKYLMRNAVVPHLRQAFDLRAREKKTRVLKVCGLGESSVDGKIGDLIDPEANPVVGLLASPGMVRVLITAEGEDAAEVAQRIDGMEQRIRERLGPLIFGTDDQTLEGVVAEELAERGYSLTIEDEATGGETARSLLTAFEGRYSIRAVMDPGGGAREPGKERLTVRVKRIAGDSPPLESFELVLNTVSGEGLRKVIRLGGPGEEIRHRLGIIVLDQLRKWLKEDEETIRKRR